MQCRLEVAAELQQRWHRTNRRWKSIPRSSSSHRVWCVCVCVCVCVGLSVGSRWPVTKHVRGWCTYGGAGRGNCWSTAHPGSRYTQPRRHTQPQLHSTLCTGVMLLLHRCDISSIITPSSGSVADWLACWAQAQKGLGSNWSRDADG